MAAEGLLRSGGAGRGGHGSREGKRPEREPQAFSLLPYYSGITAWTPLSSSGVPPPAGTMTRLVGDGVITRHQIQGIWYEKELAFDASMLKAGENRLILTVPSGPVNNGVLYDYLRLELDEGAQ